MLTDNNSQAGPRGELNPDVARNVPIPEAGRENAERDPDELRRPAAPGQMEEARRHADQGELEKEVWSILAGKLGQAFGGKASRDQGDDEAGKDMFSASILATPLNSNVFSKNRTIHTWKRLSVFENAFRRRRPVMRLPKVSCASVSRSLCPNPFGRRLFKIGMLPSTSSMELSNSDSMR
jgi:hypothetical protein